MNSPPATDTASSPPFPVSSAARLVRRIHMFTGLFLGPWMLMYALSTWVMAHRDYVLSFYPTQQPAMTTERDLEYTRAFPATSTREQIAQQILEDLGLEGRHSLSGGRNGAALIINRQHATSSRRITYNSTVGTITIQREEFRALTFLERMHRRRGYDQPYAIEDTWGFTVDFAVVTMVFWSLSGIWLWWDLKPTRKWGTLALATGPTLFVIFLFLL